MVGKTSWKVTGGGMLLTLFVPFLVTALLLARCGIVRVARKAHVLNPENRKMKQNRPERRHKVTDVVAQQMDAQSKRERDEESAFGGEGSRSMAPSRTDVEGFKDSTQQAEYYEEYDAALDRSPMTVSDL
jgi:hypothetical protein